MTRPNWRRRWRGDSPTACFRSKPRAKTLRRRRERFREVHRRRPSLSSRTYLTSASSLRDPSSSDSKNPRRRPVASHFREIAVTIRHFSGAEKIRIENSSDDSPAKRSPQDATYPSDRPTTGKNSRGKVAEMDRTRFAHRTANVRNDLGAITRRRRPVPALRRSNRRPRRPPLCRSSNQDSPCRQERFRFRPRGCRRQNRNRRRRLSRSRSFRRFRPKSQPYRRPLPTNRRRRHRRRVPHRRRRNLRHSMSDHRRRRTEPPGHSLRRRSFQPCRQPDCPHRKGFRSGFHHCPSNRRRRR